MIGEEIVASDVEERVIEIYANRKRKTGHGCEEGEEEIFSPPKKLIKEAATRDHERNIDQLEIQFEIFNSISIETKDL